MFDGSDSRVHVPLRHTFLYGHTAELVILHVPLYIVPLHDATEPFSYVAPLKIHDVVSVLCVEVHVLLVVTQSPHVGVLPPDAQADVLVWVMAPVCPSGHERVRISDGCGVQDGDDTLQEANV